jgi:hypothetical protein
MALFVDLEEEPEPPQAHQYHHGHGVKPEWSGELARQLQLSTGSGMVAGSDGGNSRLEPKGLSGPPPAEDEANRNGMTEALGCYP